MIKILFKISIITTLIALGLSCVNSSDNNQDNLIKYSDIKNVNKEELMEYNRQKAQTDRIIIERFIERRRWEMERTETGLFYQIYEKGSGTKVEEGKTVEFSYKTFLLDGSLLYSSEEFGNRNLLIGHNQKESGLDEGLRFLRVGDKARFILHPFLAFGVPGDGYKVPMNAILLYEIEIINVK